MCAAIACTLASNSQSYAYSAYAPLGYAYNQLAYSAVPYPYSAPFAAYSAPVAVGIKSQYYSDIAGHVSYGHSEPGQSQAVVQASYLILFRYKICVKNNDKTFDLFVQIYN